MDARPRHLLIAFLSTKIGCNLRKIRPTQIGVLLDEFCSPTTALRHSPLNSPRTVFQYQFLDYFAAFYMRKRKFRPRGRGQALIVTQAAKRAHRKRNDQTFVKTTLPSCTAFLQ